MSVDVDVRVDRPAPTKRRTGARRYNWDQVPVGGSFEFDDVSKEAVVGSFGHYLAAGKYAIRHLGDGRYCFWRLG